MDNKITVSRHIYRKDVDGCNRMDATEWMRAKYLPFRYGEIKGQKEGEPLASSMDAAFLSGTNPTNKPTS